MTAATATGDTVVGRATVAALARAEIARTARSPLLWLGAAGSVAAAWYVSTDGTFTEGRPVTDGYALWEWAVIPLALAAFLVGDWAALRERPSTTAELFSNTPARRWERTVGVLAAATVPAVLALLVTVGQWAAVLAQGGARLGEGRWSSALTPTPLELLGAPLSVACAFVAGVTTARLVRSRSVGAVLGFLGWVVLYPSYWIWFYAPFGLFAVSRSAVVVEDLGRDPSAAELARWDAADPPGALQESWIGADRDLGFYAAHLTYLLGAVVLLAGIALARSGPDRRTRPVLAAGLALVVLGVAGQAVLDEGARSWLGWL